MSYHTISLGKLIILYSSSSLKVTFAFKLYRDYKWNCQNPTKFMIEKQQNFTSLFDRDFHCESYRSFFFWLEGHLKFHPSKYQNIKINMNNVCQADLKIYTPACLPPTGTSFVGKTGTVYGKFSILELCILHYRPMIPPT